MAEADGIKHGEAHEPIPAEALPENVPTPAAPTGAQATRAQTVAQRLRTAREGAGLDIKTVAATTRIAPRHLEALERGDYAAMAGRPYILGFARNYARALGLDAQAVAEAVRGELDARDPAPVPRVIHQFEVGDPAKTPSQMVRWLVLLLLVAVTAMGLVFWRSYYMPAAGLPSLVGPGEPAPAPAPAAAALPPAGPAAAPAPSGPVVFTALEDGIWVKFYDGAGTQLMQKQMARDESFTLPAQVSEPRLWTGRPDALRITIGGQEVPRIAKKEGIVKDVPVSAQALLSRGTAPAVAPPAPGPAASASPASAVPAARRPVRLRPRVAAPATAPSSPVASEPAAASSPAASSTANM